jgi:hypothetical protein
MLFANEPLEPAALAKSLWCPEALGDPRRHRRLTKIVTDLLVGDEGKSPHAVRADDRGADRFFDNDHIASTELEGSARRRVQAALLGLTIVVLAHDSSEIDLHGRSEPVDAGPLRMKSSRGYLIHGCAAIDLTHHALVGIVDNWAWARNWAIQGEDRKQRAPIKKESRKWIRGFTRACAQLDASGFKGRAIHTADREADDYKVFAYAVRRKTRIDLVVRARHDRAVTQAGGHLWAEMATKPAVKTWEVRVAVEHKPVRRPAQAAAAQTKAAATKARRRAVKAEARVRNVRTRAATRPKLAAQVEAAQTEATKRREAAVAAEVAAIDAATLATLELAEARVKGPLLARLPAAPKRRTATVELRWAPVTILPTNAKEGTRPLALNAVYVLEVAPPDEVVPVEWMLLTTLPVTSVQEACFVVDCYEARWGCEEFHKILKSALDLEDRHVHDLKGFQRMLAVLTPVASHLARWTHAARVTPTEPAANHVQPDTLLALKEVSRQRGLPLPRRPWTLVDVIHRLAELGGYERRPDRVPGWIVIWRGWRILQTFWETYQFAQTRPKQAPS